MNTQTMVNRTKSLKVGVIAKLAKPAPAISILGLFLISYASPAQAAAGVCNVKCKDLTPAPV